MIKDNKIDESYPDEAVHRFNWETYTPSAGAAGMLLHINANSQCQNWNYLFLEMFRSNYEVDLAVLVDIFKH